MLTPAEDWVARVNSPWDLEVALPLLRVKTSPVLEPETVTEALVPPKVLSQVNKMATSVKVQVGL